MALTSSSLVLARAPRPWRLNWRPRGILLVPLLGILAITLAAWRRIGAAFASSRGGIRLQDQPPEANLFSLKVAELKDRCRAHGLSFFGTKAELVYRLADQMEKEAEEEKANEERKQNLRCSKAELQERCRAADLPSSGTKADLVARLEEAEEEAKIAAPATTGPDLSRGRRRAKPIFAVGEAVEGFFEDYWYQANVISHLGSGAVVVEWDEDGEHHKLEAGHIRHPVRSTNSHAGFLPGTAVMALSDEDDKWHPGVLKERHRDGRFTLYWEDLSEHTCGEEALRKITPRKLVTDLKRGQKLHGRVVEVKRYGAFLDCGVEVNGFLHTSGMHPFVLQPGLPKFLTGERVSVRSPEDGEWKFATIQKSNGDGTFQIVWAEDGNAPYKAKQDDIKSESVRLAVKVGDEVDVWVDEVRPEDSKFGVSMFENGIRPVPELSDVEDLDSSEWLDARIQCVVPVGFFVTVASPKGTQLEGFVHSSRISYDSVNVLEEFSVGDVVKVRLEEADLVRGRLQFTMLEL